MAIAFRNVYWLWLSLAVIIADQVSKQMIIRALELYERVAVAPFLNLVHMHNRGAAFSMMSEMPREFFILLAVAVSVGILIWLRRHPNGERVVAAGLSLILGGALGNVIDRARLGHVTDFIDFHVGGWHFAAFNIADAAITVGAGLLLLDMLLQHLRERTRSKASE
ncbi:MAG: signal peptidase II [Panacagrimonas sp.]